MGDEVVAAAAPAVEEAPSSGGLDINAAVEQIGRELFPPSPGSAATEPPARAPEPPAAPDPTPTPPAAHTPEPTPEPEPGLEVPKSWPEKMRQHWQKTPREVQEYWALREHQQVEGMDQYKKTAQFGDSIKQIITPYQAMIAAQGLDVPRAVERLLSAQQALTTGTPEQRLAAYQKLGRDLRLFTEGQDGTQAPVDPLVQQLQDELAQLKAGVEAQQKLVTQERYQQTAQHVDAFAKDPAHPYFDEVTDGIAHFIEVEGLSLQDAYDRAVWANPVTREKELARIRTETETKFKEKARLDALPKKKAAGVNVQTKDSQRAPTERTGSMDDTLKETLSAIKARG
jgi:hypothetical protein